MEFGIFGFLLVIMMVLRPQGLIPERRRRLELTAGDRGRGRPARGEPVRGSTAADDRDPDARRRPPHAVLRAEHVTKEFGGLVAVAMSPSTSRSTRSCR